MGVSFRKRRKYGSMATGRKKEERRKQEKEREGKENWRSIGDFGHKKHMRLSNFFCWFYFFFSHLLKYLWPLDFIIAICQHVDGLTADLQCISPLQRSSTRVLKFLVSMKSSFNLARIGSSLGFLPILDAPGKNPSSRRFGFWYGKYYCK